MAKHESGKIRVLAIYNMLQRGNRITVRQIQRELELHYGITANRRTIYSDIYAIDRIVPIEVTTGRYGGYQKVDVIERCNE